MTSQAATFQEDVALSRVTTIGTGGLARAYAEPRTIAELEHTLRAARERGLDVATVGLGSNLLAADAGVDMLVLRLAGELAEARTEGTVLVAGGGATNAVCLHRARAAALGGFEFACAIPGTAGGGVWMNAGAYGSDWSAIVMRALVATADGTGWLTPAELGFSYRHSILRHGQVVAAVEYQLVPSAAARARCRHTAFVAPPPATRTVPSVRASASSPASRSTSMSTPASAASRLEPRPTVATSRPCSRALRKVCSSSTIVRGSA